MRLSLSRPAALPALVSLLALPAASAAGELRFRHHFIDRDLQGGEYGQTSLVDLDGDGDLDFITGRRQGGTEVFWFEHQAPDRWVRHVLGMDHPSDVGGTAFDVDCDGRVDHVSGGVWYRNHGAPRERPFERIVFDPELHAVHDLAAADLDGDGRLDVVTMSDRNNLRWYRIPDDPRKLWPRVDVGPGVHSGVAAADLDGDGDLDLARSNAWFENTDGRGGRWIERANIPFGNPRDPYPLATRCAPADLDGDGDLDLVMTENEIRAGRIGWLENVDGKGGSWRLHPLEPGDPAPRGGCHSLAAADFDGDGDLDVFTSEMENIPGDRLPRWFIWENLDGKGGRFAERVILDLGLGGHEAVVGDVDGDGDLDIASKLWTPRKDNGNGGRNHADYVENLLVERLVPAEEPFLHRGYYFILSRNPAYGLDDYRFILDRMAADRANLLILWIGGGFASRRYAETWDYNREHKNVREDFAGKAIEHAHARGIKVLLGLTPFAYDGVNRYGEAHPEIGAVDESGKPAVTGGIHSIGRGLCPSKPAAREFMMGYCRELFEDFYPQADGFFLEHSDYGVCRCRDCVGEGALRREWEFVEALSRRVWERKPGAMMLVYPQYAALGLKYDPRYVVFVAPHNQKGLERLKNPKVLWAGYWDEGMLFLELCRRARREGYAGVIPSMENFTYENPHAFDARWGPPGSAGWDDLLVRLSRLSFREGAAKSELDQGAWKAAVKREFFGPQGQEAWVDDLLHLHRLLNRWEGWTWRAGVMRIPKAKIDPAALDARTREALAEAVTSLRALAGIHERARAAGAPPAPAAETLRRMADIAAWVIERWQGKLPGGE